jgi:uncharacterized repeat protein (TIGR01451 family)
MKTFTTKQLGLIGLGAIATLSLLPINGAPAATRVFDAGRTMASNLLQKPQVELNLVAQTQVKDAKGQIAWQPLDSKVSVQPGTALRFEVKANNLGDRPAEGFALTQPVPQGMEYKAGTAVSNAKAEVVFSIDNGKTFVATPVVSVKQADGQVAMQPAPVASYTHVRWNFKQALAAKAQQQMAYEVRVK